MQEFQNQLDVAKSGPIHNPKLVYLRPKFSPLLNSYEWEWGYVMEEDLDVFRGNWTCVQQPNASFNYPIFVRNYEVGLFNKINKIGKT